MSLVLDVLKEALLGDVRLVVGDGGFDTLSVEVSVVILGRNKFSIFA